MSKRCLTDGQGPDVKLVVFYFKELLLLQLWVVDDYFGGLCRDLARLASKVSHFLLQLVLIFVLKDRFTRRQSRFLLVLLRHRIHKVLGIS